MIATRAPAVGIVVAAWAATWAVAVAACGGGGGTTDAGPADADTTDADTTDAPPQPDADTTDAPPQPPGAVCDTAIELVPGVPHMGDTTDLVDFVSATCSPGAAAAPDALYTVDLGEDNVDLLVTATVDESADPPFDVVLHARTTCTTRNSEVGCIDAGWSESLEVLDLAGLVTVVVDGTSHFGGANAGAYTIEAQLRTIAGDTEACDPSGVTSRCASGFRCVDDACTADSEALACAEADDLTADLAGGTAERTRTTWGFEPDYHEGSCAFEPDNGLPEHIYRFDLAVASDVVATTDFPETTLDTHVYLRDDACDGAELGCDDDVDPMAFNLASTLSVNALPAGTYYLFVDGSSPSPGTGTYRLQVTATPN